LTASYEARPYGIHSAMPLYHALELCPNLIVVPPNGQRYRECSAAIFALVEALGCPYESMSLDEAYMDLEEYTWEQACELVRKLRADAHDITGLTISAGLGNSKLIAKIASDVGKPNGFTIVEPGTESTFLAPLPIGRLYGIGKKSEPRFLEAGITTIGDILTADNSVLYPLLGRSIDAYRDLARGIDDRVVTPFRERKSISSETTFEHNLSGESRLLPIIAEQAQELAETLQRKHLRAGSIGIKIKRPNFSQSGKQTMLKEPTNDARIIYAAARHCLRSGGFTEEPLRLIGTKVAHLTDDTTRQLPLW
jgi:DNA polymerase-4